MNPWALAAGAGLTALWFLGAKGSRKVERGKAYEAIFNLPPAARGLVEAEYLKLIPEGSAVATTAGGTQLKVRFVAPATAEITSINSPFGLFEVVSVRPLS